MGNRKWEGGGESFKDKPQKPVLAFALREDRVKAGDVGASRLPLLLTPRQSPSISLSRSTAGLKPMVGGYLCAAPTCLLWAGSSDLRALRLTYGSGRLGSSPSSATDFGKALPSSVPQFPLPVK